MSSGPHRCEVELYRVDIAETVGDGRELNHCERVELVRRLLAQSYSSREMAERTKISQRLIDRYRATLRERQAASA